LNRCPEYIGRAVLVQVGVHRKGRHADYQQSKNELELVVQFINSRFFARAQGNVIDYREVDERFPFPDRLALWRVADVQVTTVLRDGLNTGPFEYVAAHK